jgi:hypothetical protein
MTFALVLKNEPQVIRDHCCEQMTAQANLQSPMVESPLLGTTNKRIYWSALFDEYGLICQPSAEILLIANCPFCGSALPGSRRDEWMRKLEATGWRTWDDPIPSHMLTEQWHAA